MNMKSVMTLTRATLGTIVAGGVGWGGGARGEVEDMCKECNNFDPPPPRPPATVRSGWHRVKREGGGWGREWG